MSTAHFETHHTPSAHPAPPQHGWVDARPVVPAVVWVRSTDAVLGAGTVSLLRNRPEVRVTTDPTSSTIVVTVADRVDERCVRLLEESRSDRPNLLVVSDLDGAAVVTGAEAGATGFLRRCDTDSQRLAQTISACCNGENPVPNDLISGLIASLGRMSATVTDPSPRRLSTRELEVLRLVSDGIDTAEIARQLSYSERTVKSVIHGITTRLHLNNRTHAVAYAVRHGLI